MELRLAEELLLIALDDEKGTIISSASLAIGYGLAGAILMEMAENKKIEMDGKKLKLVNPGLTGDFVIDRVVEMISKSKKDRTLQHWVSQIGYKIKDIKEKLLEDLINKVILEKKEGKVLWIFTTKKYPTRYDKPENLVRKRIIDIVMNQGEADSRSLMLISLIEACELTKEVFRDKEEYKIAKKRIKELAAGDMVNKAIHEAVQAIQAAIMASVAAAAASAAVTAATS
ncbi:MAG: hypothetical protein GTO45_02350 [Candidatus Aminicenantes bacterium]|nr:hypothetical protein [Candidatus Aminicenantes bacterium]NIM77564.1 hypothetical protein [Candidatus Aminicenantes bacterium]NIN16886.1 hypothetical protein [Candidatus Aminicenantes bacterium]NIN40774.1 hypothetical protein [Candidatus Aminicenantes bacterium]NIN83583.1 hypothetical protein [Candidatus Aminicenantes bacterium]